MKHILMETGIGITVFYPILFFSILSFRGIQLRHFIASDCCWPKSFELSWLLHNAELMEQRKKDPEIAVEQILLQYLSNAF